MTTLGTNNKVQKRAWGEVSEILHKTKKRDDEIKKLKWTKFLIQLIILWNFINL